MPRKRKMPEVWGSFEVAEFLDIYVQNLSGRNAPAGMPEPFGEVKATRLWLADEVRAFAPGFFKRRAERELHRDRLGKLREAGARAKANRAASA